MTTATESAVSSKPCSACGSNKPLGEFSPNKKGLYGRASVCKSCRALRASPESSHAKRIPMRHRIDELIGATFGRLTVQGFHSVRRERCMVVCRCDCGNERVVDFTALRSGHTKSCGCKRRVIHGLHKHWSYVVWNGIKQRCTNPKNDSYPWYGGRGIKMCERWLNSPQAFLDDMGQRPTPTHSIDRINNDGDYEPGNCRWATVAEQVANRGTKSQTALMTGKVEEQPE